MMKICQVVIRQCEGHTQHKPKVVDNCEPFRDFLHQILKEKVLKQLQLSPSYCKSFADIGLHAVFIEFCKFYG